jgi:hypothetical protein
MAFIDAVRVAMAGTAAGVAAAGRSGLCAVTKSGDRAADATAMARRRFERMKML